MRHETDVLQYIRSTFKSWGFLKQIKKLLGQATGISGTSSKAKLPIRPTDRGLSVAGWGASSGASVRVGGLIVYRDTIPNLYH